MSRLSSPAERDIVVFDTEFHSRPGCHPEPICLVARSVRTQRTLRVAGDQLRDHNSLQHMFGGEAVFVAFQAEADIACLLALGWEIPENLIDLRVETLVRINGCGFVTGIPNAAQSLSLERALLAMTGKGIDTARKAEMRLLAMRGGPFSQEETQALLDYCESDVLEAERLFRALEAMIQWPHALIRGDYIKTAAAMERTGVPVDRQGLDRLAASAPLVRRKLTQRTTGASAFYEHGHFREGRFARWLADQGIPWNHTPNGKLVLRNEYLKEQSGLHPVVEELRQLRKAMISLGNCKLPVGPDNRNRTGLRPFASLTGRNQPPSSEFIFGQPRWWRGYIMAESGRALALLDFCQQEFGIAAALSGDERMQEAYRSGDPYLDFGRQIGLIPAHGTAETHMMERERCKSVRLGVQYGMGVPGLARRLKCAEAEAEELLRQHRLLYPKFWKYVADVENYALLKGELHTAFGWRFGTGEDTKPGTLQNFPMQANGAEILRLASILMHQHGIRVCAPVHDAFVIEAPPDEIDHVCALAQSLMRRTSAIVLGGFEIRTAEECRLLPGQRMLDAKSTPMWDLVQGILKELADVDADMRKQRLDEPGSAQVVP